MSDGPKHVGEVLGDFMDRGRRAQLAVDALTLGTRVGALLNLLEHVSEALDDDDCGRADELLNVAYDDLKRFAAELGEYLERCAR